MNVRKEIQISMKRFIMVYTKGESTEDFVLERNTKYIYNEFMGFRWNQREVSYRVVKKDMESKDVCLLNLIDKGKMLFAGLIIREETKLSLRKNVLPLVDNVTVYSRSSGMYIREIVLGVGADGCYVVEGDDFEGNDAPIGIYTATVCFNYYQVDGKDHMMNITFHVKGITGYDFDEYDSFFLYDGKIYNFDREDIEIEPISTYLRGMLFK